MNSSGSESRIAASAETGRTSVPSRRVVEVLRPGLCRLIAPNPSVMTGAGTNTYFVGESELVVVDPGPEDDQHLARLIEHGGDELAFVLVTHHHDDHAPLARILADRAGVPLLAYGHERSPAPDRRLRDGEVLEVDGFSISVLHTPGHASDHCCFLVSATTGASGWSSPVLLTGDHVMSGSTVVVAPPDGDMTRYLDSLERLISADLGTFTIAPGHGELIPQGGAKLLAYLQHRKDREKMVVEALGHGPASPAELVPRIYSRLAPALLRPAAASVWAHLRRLEGMGMAHCGNRDDPSARWWSAVTRGTAGS